MLEADIPFVINERERKETNTLF